MTARVVLAIAKIAPGAASYRTIGKPLLVQLGNTCLSVQQSRAAYVLRSFHSNCAACSAGTSTYCNELEQVLSRVKSGHKKNNIPSSIVDKIGRNLHLAKNHPLGIIKTNIETYCNEYAKVNGQESFQLMDNLSPVVGVQECFDMLRVPPEHISRQPSDTYYIDETTVLRTHTSAHQCAFIAAGIKAFLCSGDVYRRDEIDASHYPVFHQMEGVRIFDNSILLKHIQSVRPTPLEPQESLAQLLARDQEAAKIVEKYIVADLQQLLSGLAKHLFGEDSSITWREDYFPFTEPSYELEVLFQNSKWLEVLGCGVIHKDVMKNSGKEGQLGWAFGLGLERLAMVLFDIPDIRLFWSQDERFIQQFKDGVITKFCPYSKYPLCYKDVSFWLPRDSVTDLGDDVKITGFHSNDVYELIREIAGDLVEKVELFDTFTKRPKKKHDNVSTMVSHAYRITYRHMDRSLTNKEVDEIQQQVRDSLTEKLGVTLR